MGRLAFLVLHFLQCACGFGFYNAKYNKCAMISGLAGPDIHHAKPSPHAPEVLWGGWGSFCRLGGRSCGGARVMQTLGISGDPSSDNCNHQEASRNEQKPPRSLWDLLATVQQNPGTQVLCFQLSFSGVLWAVWVGASWGGAPVVDHK